MDIRRLTVFAAALLATLPLALSATAREQQRQELVVFAAASLTDVLGELSSQWARSSGTRPKLSFAASSVLARQIEAGGQANLFIPADQEWMDYLQSRGLIDISTRRNIVGNRLVLIAPADSITELRIARGLRLAEALGGGRLSTGDPETVPVGRYARSALMSLGLWENVRDRLVRADNARSALMFVARGETPLGIVYMTDALADPKVRILDTFPENSHAPITYPAAATRGRTDIAVDYLDFLGSPAARDTWKRFGFVEPKK